MALVDLIGEAFVDPVFDACRTDDAFALYRVITHANPKVQPQECKCGCGLCRRHLLIDESVRMTSDMM